MNLIIVGSVAFDAIETPYGKTEKIIGGAGTYISLAASYFSTKTGLVSVVGYDFPKAEIELLNNHGIDTSGLQIKEKEKTFFWSGKYHKDLNTRDTIATELNVLATFDPVLPETFKETEYLILGNLTPIVQRQVIERMKKRPKLIVMDTMNFWMNKMYDELIRTISLVDVLSINDEEARQLSGEFSLIKAAKKILKLGPKYLIIKKGEHGALLFGEGKIFSAPALPIEEVFDPTGAGDSFAGGFIGYLSQQKSINFEKMKTAIIVGSAMASFCIEKFGTEKLINLDKAIINKRITEFIELVKFDYN